ncbi:MAG TPA: antibiotic biosynthesis monooxygenase [Kofleriaceae bacterium]|nr:antibiotic biosynthesis monooxygenase [Kofleriaceae bacterium]
MKHAIVAHLEAKPGKEDELAQLLIGARALAVDENFTRTWYAWRTGPRSLGIFDTFDNEAGRKAHLEGRIAQALMGKADELLASPPDLRMADVLAVK